MLPKLLVFLFVAVVGLTLGKLGPETICPPAYFFNASYITHTDYRTHCSCSKACYECPAMTECSEMFDTQTLIHLYEETTDYTFWDFSLVRAVLQYIPGNTIVDKRVRKFRLINSTFRNLFDEAPTSNNRLQELELTNVRILGGVDWEHLSNLVHLKEFNATNVKTIREIGQKFVLNFPQGVEGLYLRQVGLKRIDDDAFSKLANLTRILIRNTEISVLKRSMFPPVSKLLAMHFSGNKISSLPDDLFTNMPDLMVVDFSNTNVVTLPESVFGGIMPQLSVLYLEGNAVNCGCQMKWIQQLQVASFPLGVPPLGVNCTKPRELEGYTLNMFKEDHFLHCEDPLLGPVSRERWQHLSRM